MNPKPLHQKLYVHQNTCTPRIFSTKELYTKNRYSYSKQFLHQRALRRTPFTPEAFSSYTSYTRGLFAPQVHTKVPLHQGTFTFSSVCTKEPPKSFYTKTYQTTLPKPEAHQRALTPRDFCTRRFYTTLTTEYVYTKKKSTKRVFPPEPFAPEALHTKDFLTFCTQNLYSKRFLYHKGFILHQTVFKPERVYSRNLFRQRAGTRRRYFKEFPNKKKMCDRKLMELKSPILLGSTKAHSIHNRSGEMQSKK